MIARVPSIKGTKSRRARRFWIAAVAGADLNASCLIAACLITSCLIGPAAAQQPAATKRPTVALPALTAQGFEVKAAFASYLVLQKGKDVWLCYMLQTRSTCEPAE
jgi:hypothetical protein